ncbi:hypothetical protein P8452_54889 [Trifolium repens]|nr:hypothetical protein P8452_54889 [Trifolium repens]
MSVNRKRTYDSISSPSPSTSLLQTNTTLSRLPLPPLSKTKSLFEIISTNSLLTVEKSLEDSCIDVTPQDIEQVLQLSYWFPAQAFKFFRWASHRINHNHTPYAWNLLIDILGRIAYAVRTFEVMNDYGCVQDVISLNLLMSAICGSGRVIEACNYLQTAKKFVRPDYETYAILMEGLESDGNVVGAKENFYDMIFEIGWYPANVHAYDLFLCTLIKGSDGIREALKFFDLLRDRGCYPGIRFFGIVLDECVRFHDITRAEFFWEIMLGKTKLQPTTAMCNSMIAMYCYHGDNDAAINMLDGMVFMEAFPNSLTYNLLFGCLIKRKKLWEASEMFTEMVLNGCMPDQLNCDAAVRAYLDNEDPVMAINVWECLVDNYREDLEGTANLLVVGLLDNDKVLEAVMYAEHIIGRGIKLTSSTLSKLRQSLVKEGKESVYEELVAKWKAAY